MNIKLASMYTLRTHFVSLLSDRHTFFIEEIHILKQFRFTDELNENLRSAMLSNTFKGVEASAKNLLGSNELHRRCARHFFLPSLGCFLDFLCFRYCR